MRRQTTPLHFIEASLAVDVFPKPFTTAANTLFLCLFTASLVFHSLVLLAMRRETIRHDTSERFITVELNAIAQSPAPAARLKQANRTLPGHASVNAHNPVPAIPASVSATPPGTPSPVPHRVALSESIPVNHLIPPAGATAPAAPIASLPRSVPTAPAFGQGAAQPFTANTPPRSAGAPPASSGNAQAEHAAYLSQLRNLIESHKEYPAMARKSGMEGTVHVRFILGRDGLLRQTDIARSSGKSLLDKVAMRAVASVSRFPAIPESLNGSSLIFEVPVIFKLKVD
jgi:TonB family protein